eukprot:jgi/Mesen1/9635/ME000669S09077
MEERSMAVEYEAVDDDGSLYDRPLRGASVSASTFRGLFPSTEGDTPNGRMFAAYIRAWRVAVVVSPRSIDDHINVVGWRGKAAAGWATEGEGDARVAAFEIENDSWLPRVELQAGGGDNTVRGLALDLTSTQLQVADPRDDSGQEKLPPSPVLLCITLEGKLCAYACLRLDDTTPGGLVAPPCPLPPAGPPGPAASLASAAQSPLGVAEQRQQGDERRHLTPAEHECKKMEDENGEEGESEGEGSSGLAGSSLTDSGDGGARLHERVPSSSSATSFSSFSKLGAASTASASAAAAAAASAKGEMAPPQMAPLYQRSFSDAIAGAAGGPSAGGGGGFGGPFTRSLSQSSEPSPSSSSSSAAAAAASSSTPFFQRWAPATGSPTGSPSASPSKSEGSGITHAQTPASAGPAASQPPSKAFAPFPGPAAGAAAAAGGGGAAGTGGGPPELSPGALFGATAVGAKAGSDASRAPFGFPSNASQASSSPFGFTGAANAAANAAASAAGSAAFPSPAFDFGKAAPLNFGAGSGAAAAGSSAFAPPGSTPFAPAGSSSSGGGGGFSFGATGSASAAAAPAGSSLSQAHRLSRFSPAAAASGSLPPGAGRGSSFSPGGKYEPSFPSSSSAAAAAAGGGGGEASAEAEEEVSSPSKRAPFGRHQRTGRLTREQEEERIWQQELEEVEEYDEERAWYQEQERKWQRKQRGQEEEEEEEVEEEQEQQEEEEPDFKYYMRQPEPDSPPRRGALSRAPPVFSPMAERPRRSPPRFGPPREVQVGKLPAPPSGSLEEADFLQALEKVRLMERELAAQMARINGDGGAGEQLHPQQREQAGAAEEAGGFSRRQVEALEEELTRLSFDVGALRKGVRGAKQELDGLSAEQMRGGCSSRGISPRSPKCG